MLQAPETTVIVRQVDWVSLATVIVANLAGILMAFAFIISAMKGNFKIMFDKLDGHFTKMIDTVAESKETKGKVEALMNQAQPKIITDRREK